MNIFRFQVDPEHVKRYNELLRDSSRVHFSALSLAVVLLAGAALSFFFLNNRAWAFTLTTGLIILAVLIVFIGIAARRASWDANKIYQSYPLAPGIIVDENERELYLMALVNSTVSPHQPPKWAVAISRMTQIPGTDRRVGQKVPVVAVGARATRGDQAQWRMVVPMPIAWGTPDQSVVTAACQAIDPQQWQQLEKARGLYDATRRAEYNLIEL